MAYKGEHKKMVEKEKIIYLRFNVRLISKDNEKIYNRQGRFFLSDKFKAFESHIKWECKSQYKNQPLVGDLQVLIIAYFKNKKHCDIGNAPKSLLDSLEKIIYANDNQIKKLMIEVIENSKAEFIEMWIKEG